MTIGRRHCCNVLLAQVEGIVTFTFVVNADKRSLVIAVEPVMRRKRLRRLSTEQAPLRTVCTRTLRHATIVVTRERVEITACKACRGNGTCPLGLAFLPWRVPPAFLRPLSSDPLSRNPNRPLTSQ